MAFTFKRRSRLGREEWMDARNSPNVNRPAVDRPDVDRPDVESAAGVRPSSRAAERRMREEAEDEQADAFFAAMRTGGLRGGKHTTQR